MIRSVMVLVGLLVAVFVVAAAGSQFTDTGAWYQALQKPAWNPPGWVFGPVWTALYILMAVAAWMVWRSARRGEAALPLTLWGVQLVLNMLWTLIFFTLRSPGWAFVEILVLWVAIFATTWSFWRVRVWAGALMLPYLLWTTYAAALNFAIWRMN